MYSGGVPGPGDLGRRIATRRKHLGWSREQLAVRAGLSVSYLAYIETYPAVVTAACLTELADALETTVGALLGAGSAGQEVGTVREAWADPWLPDAITGRHGERPGPCLA